MKEGQAGDNFFVALTGQAKVTVKDRTVHRILPGDHFGEISLLDGGVRTATVTSETPMTLLMIERGDFLKTVERDPDLAVALAREPGPHDPPRRPFAGPVACSPMKVEFYVPAPAPPADQPDAKPEPPDAGRLRRLARRLGRDRCGRPGACRAARASVPPDPGGHRRRGLSTVRHPRRGADPTRRPGMVPRRGAGPSHHGSRRDRTTGPRRHRRRLRPRCGLPNVRRLRSNASSRTPESVVTERRLRRATPFPHRRSCGSRSGDTRRPGWGRTRRHRWRRATWRSARGPRRGRPWVW